MAKQTIKGVYRPKNKAKYKGNVANINYRSSWELQMMRFLDMNENILEWSSEETVIGYKHPIKGTFHRYFPDFFCKKKTKNGKIVQEIIEIKPIHEAVPPVKKPKQSNKAYTRAVLVYAVNKAKWEAAKKFCQKKGYEFVVMTQEPNSVNFRILTEEQMGLE